MSTVSKKDLLRITALVSVTLVHQSYCMLKPCSEEANETSKLLSIKPKFIMKKNIEQYLLPKSYTRQGSLNIENIIKSYYKNKQTFKTSIFFNNNAKNLSRVIGGDIDMWKKETQSMVFIARLYSKILKHKKYYCGGILFDAEGITKLTDLGTQELDKISNTKLKKVVKKKYIELVGNYERYDCRSTFYALCCCFACPLDMIFSCSRCINE